jgi:membrane associated rhomboid family serine protease
MHGQGRPADGALDFSGFSTAQLRDLEYAIDRQAYPLNYHNLQLELQRRGQEAAAAPPPPPQWPVELTEHTGLRGWLEAKARGLALYGAGSVEPGAGELLLRGWRRTWLGVACRAELSVAFEKILNVAQEDRLVRFEVQQRLRRRRFEFRLESAAQASRLAALLPVTRTPAFDRDWRELHEFNVSLRRTSPHAWITPSLVALNGVVFLAMAATQRRLYGFDLQQLISWGANYGPLTAGGQWWRLLTAEFLHLSVIHLLVNMWAFWSVGRLTERLFGRWIFLGLYLASAMLASLSSIAWNPALVGVGASGAIFGAFGAFLAFLIQRQTRVPAAVFRAHWFSTLAFVLFNLVSGALQTGVDNAAHIGGLLTGFALGWILARPFEAPARSAPSLRQALGAGLLILGMAAAGMWESGGIGSQFPPTQQYMKSHFWYVDGEAHDLRLWQQLAADDQMGLISSAALGNQFKADIVPFWESSYARLSKESPPPPAQRETATLLREYVHVRLEWARAVVDAAANNSSESGQKTLALSKQANLLVARIMRVAMLGAAARRAPGLINSSIGESLRTLYSSHDYRCVTAPTRYSLPVGRNELQTDYPVVADGIACAAQRAFERRDFATLDAMFRGKNVIDDLPAGGSTYGAAVSGLDDLIEYGSMQIADLLRLTADWRYARPDSPLPGVVEAMIFEDWAWAARGTGYANSVSTQSWAVFAARSEMAVVSLRQSASQGRSTPLWYWLSISVGLDQGLPSDQLRAIFDQGYARFPGYLPLYRAMLRTLMPRWGGSYQKVDQFINAIYAKTWPSEGTRMYTRLYWAYGLMEGDDVNIFTDAQAEWRYMKPGFKQLLASYPRSDYVLNAYADFACRANDKAQYEALRPQLDTRLSASAWTKKFTLAACDRKFGLPSAAGNAPQAGKARSSGAR